MASDGISGYDIWNGYIKFVSQSSVSQVYKCSLISFIPIVFNTPDDSSFICSEDNLEEEIERLKGFIGLDVRSIIADDGARRFKELMRAICKEYYPITYCNRFLSNEISPSTLSSLFEALNKLIFSKQVISVDLFSSFTSIDGNVVLVSREILKNAQLEEITDSSVPEKARSYIRKITLDISENSILNILKTLNIDEIDINQLKNYIREHIIAFCTLSGSSITENNGQISFTGYLDDFKANIDYYDKSIDGIQARINCGEEYREYVLDEIERMIREHPYIKSLMNGTESTDLAWIADAVTIDVNDNKTTIDNKISNTKAFEEGINSNEDYSKPVTCRFIISQGRPSFIEISKYTRIKDYLLESFHLVNGSSYKVSPDCNSYIYEIVNPTIIITIEPGELLAFICTYCHEREMANKLKDKQDQPSVL